MPRRSLEEDFVRRLIISIFLIALLQGFGLLISLFIFLPWIERFLRETGSWKPYPGPEPVPRPMPRKPHSRSPNRGISLTDGLIFEAPKKLIQGAEALIKVGFRNRTGKSLRVSIDLSELALYGKLERRTLDLYLLPGEERSEYVRFVPSKVGKHALTVRVRSGPFMGKKAIEIEITGEKAGGNGLEALLSRYERVELIGEGGFGKVYRALRDGRWVALKVPHVLNERTGKLFLREVSIWRELRHGNIVKLHDANLTPYPYIEMELCDRSLEDLEKPLPAERVAEIAFEVAEGLKYAHSKGIIHRDLKPSNVLLRGSKPKISDWGLAKVLFESGTTTVTAMTPYYASPEQISPSRFGGVDERTDVWQLGVLMYELATGRRPFEGSDFVEVAGRIIMEEPRRPSELNPEAKPLEGVILRCLSKEKERRYGSVEELQRDLSGILGGKYREELKKSVGPSRSAYYAGQLFLLHLRLGDAKEALKYARDLLRYARGREREELEKLIEQIELRVEEGLPVPRELVEKGEVVVHGVGGNPSNCSHS
ncbi:serine/threonine-protein kinase [Thermococcus sp. 9N3]|uniref:serine/threonine-protein kinase n=1 Tax=Thermococcus sp. 9N3 TaxID=163002 RepID=UPI00142FCB78|nr:serine/threonine-protein kinase [Thermococcus sp. 9N3]NJE48425.1 serine/threonine protein kinase [Thermococcus sp. 9N3]